MRNKLTKQKRSTFMKETILKTASLTKMYAHKPAVDHVNMHVKKGDIYGFIGQNGAGKTTLIRMVTGLIGSTSGEIMLFSDTFEQNLEKKRKRIGSIVETPAFYPQLTAQQNLEYYCIQRGIPDTSCIGRMLHKVGLADIGNKKFRQFSLGMKQRLGLALSLIANPDFVILDEPINGLDPMGIIEFRSIIQQLNQQNGITFLISSHILTELAQVATNFGIIHQGRLITEITKAQLEQETQTALSITVDNPAAATAILEQQLQITNYKVLSENEIRVQAYLNDPAEITFQLSNHGVRVASATKVGTSLEDYFLKTIGYTNGGTQNV